MIIVFSFKTKVVHGDDSAFPNINTVYALFDVPSDEKNGFENETSSNNKKNGPKKGTNNWP